VNIAGFAAENILSDLVKIVHWHELDEAELSRSFLLDVRQPEEYKLGKIEGAKNIPLNSLRGRLEELPREGRIIVYCAAGLRAYLACRILSQLGFPEVYNLSGGYKTYAFVTEKQANEDIFEGDVIGKDDNIYQAAVEQA
jgi:rhodanese-related sulfurtransferase